MRTPYSPAGWLLGLFLLLTFSVMAQSPAPRSVADILNPDGSIRPGAPGAFDAAGYELQYGPNGEPRLRPTAAGDEHWREGFAVGGTDGGVNAIAVAPNGDVYIGGYFRYVGTAGALNLARWDGVRWWPVGAGKINGVIRALAIQGNNLYVGGTIRSVDSVSVRNVARWDGSRWHALGNGTSSVQTLAVAGTALYVGGSGVSRWDGTTWTQLGSGYGPGYPIYALAWVGNTLYAGGDFSVASGSATDYLARWDGTNWQSFGGINGPVHALTTAGGDLYVGGEFTTAGNGSAAYVARWNGAAWSGLNGGVAQPVYALHLAGAHLYAGTATSAPALGGRATNCEVMHWDGVRWASLGGSPSRVLASAGGYLCAGGPNMPGTLGGLARWNGARWQPWSPGITDYVRTMARIGTDVYVGGLFDRVDTVESASLARWDGTRWHAVPGQPNGAIYTMLAEGGNLYVGGDFTRIGGIAARHIARWDGQRWHPLGSGTDSTVLTLAMMDSTLFVGGRFARAGSSSANRIAQWNGSVWNAVGAGNQGADAYDYVGALLVEGRSLYAGGTFRSMDAVPTASLARWDGSAWSAIGNGQFGLRFVSSLAIFQSELYVGGVFYPTTGWLRFGLKRWNWQTSGWTDVILNYTNPVDGGSVLAMSIGENGAALYVAGSFPDIDGVPAHNLARFDGRRWHPLGSGLNGAVNALVVSDSVVVAGGEFTFLGNESRVAGYFAIYDPSYQYVNGLPAEAAGRSRFSLYPNPAPAGRVRLVGTRATAATILDAAGRAVRRAPIGFDGALDVNGLPPGLYLVRAGTATARLVVE